MPQNGNKDVIVPTIDTIRLSYLLELLIVNNYKTLCIGPTGTGKSVLITNKIINGMPTKNYLPVILNFSARTSANQTQDFIDSKLEKRRKNIYGPPINHKMIIFIDDLNMPMLDVCDSQPAIELIRQYLDHGGWYDRKNIGSFNELQDMILVCAMGLPGGGRNPITPRFTRHCNMISFTEMEDQSLRKIFSTILSSFMSVFPEEVSELCEPLVEASIEIYNTIRKELLPTPAKSHYTFNLRDLSKVFKGMLDVGPSTILEPYDIVRLWIHECLRVFQDRLIDDIDRNWFLDEIKSVMYDMLDMEYPDVVMQEPLIYGDYMNPNSDNKIYSEVKDLKKLAKVIDNYLEDYNTSVTSPMKLVLFLDAVEHISKICRIIRQPQGNALLLGVGGSGRQSLSKLAIFMEDYEIYQIELSKNYGIQEWHDDLKHIMMGAGLEEKSIVFLISDTQIVSETYFEDINNILNSGDVPNIYTSDEMDQIINNMRQRFPQTNTFIPTKENLFALYVGRVKKFLHLILCMSPMGESFTTRLRMFPSLVNCCTIDWFTMWPEEALQSVAANFISELSDIGDEEVMEGIVTYCVYIHESVRQKCIQFESELNRFNFVTPKSYLELLTLYKTLLEKKKNDLTTLRNRISTGLEKLLNATKEVQNLQEELKNTQPLLLQTSQEVEKTMKQISEDKAAAQVIRESVLKKEEFASNKAQETQKIADESQRDLDEALPALDAALESLNSLSKNDVIEVRSMQRPPEGVKLVIEAVCIMKGIKPKRVDGDKIGKKVDDYWDVGKALLADPAKFLDSLMKFDKDNISEQTILKIKPYIESPEFQVSVIAHVSKAAKSICQWVRAMEKYYWVAKAVAPKREKLREAQKILEETLASLAESKRELETVDNNIRDMEKQYDDLILKKEELKQKVDECNLKLTRAQKLITGLADERKRWSESVSGFDKSIENAVGDILIASGSIAYLGAFSSEYRAELIDEWMDEFSTLSIPHSTNVSLWDILGDPVLLRDWEVHGLPKDTFSRDNGLIIHHSQRWPLLIDPQGQANKWIRNMEREKNIEIIKLSDQNYIRTLENAIRFGKPVLIENIGEKLDPALDPILLRQVYLQGGSQVIKLGDNIIPYHSDFKLYITTKLPNPHYTPEIYAMLTIVNFTLAPSGLEDQLLGIVVANERPDLEEIKNSLVISNAQMKKELKDIEDKILYLLSTVQGSPVDDERLIDTLAASKITSSEIKEKVQEAEITEKDIDVTRNSYSAVAVRTRILFFCIVELSAIDPMYQYSLTWFLNLFVNSITNSEPSDDIEMRITNINDYFTFSLYTNICRSLFEKHKLMFSFLLTARILMNENKIDEEEYKFLITGTVSNKVELDKPNPAERWLTSQSWNEIQMLSSLKSFEGFDEEVTKKTEIFEKIFDSQNPHKERLSGRWHSKLNQFQKILVLRCIRVDRVITAIQEFVADVLGEQFIEPQNSALSELHKESSPMTPLIFILSAGADPATNLYKYAEEAKFNKKLYSVSLGQGQGPRAEKLVQDGMEKGLWILLQNCHLSPSWMPTLDKIVDSISLDKVHRDFRLWLTSMPSDKFPVAILQNGIKLTVEPSFGIKANLMRTYSTVNDEYLDNCRKPIPWRRLHFALAFFHAVVQERRKFGSLGWNIPYEFTEGDLQICTKQLKMYLEEYDEIPFKVLKYTVGQINYGGRVTDDWDRRLIMNILDGFYCPEALKEGYKFSSSGIYYSIPGENSNSYKNYIKSLPIDETAEIFSMHENANISYAQKEVYSTFATLLMLMPHTSKSSTGESREDQLLETTKSIEEKIPYPMDLEEIQKKYPTDYSESMSTVLVQEVVRYNKLLAEIHSSLKEVMKALKGLVVMSETLESMCDSIYINQVPEAWHAKAYPSLKSLSGWVNDLNERIKFIKHWIDNGIPNVFWISGFFFPQAFLTGTLQNYARKYKYSIDILSFDFIVIETPVNEVASRPEDGCYIYGLFLEGARWDSDLGVLAESNPKVLYTKMPIVWLLPVPNRVKPDQNIYECPVYKTLTRAGTLSTTGHSTNYVLTIELPSDKPQSHWIKRGVALICSLKSDI